MTAAESIEVLGTNEPLRRAVHGCAAFCLDHLLGDEFQGKSLVIQLDAPGIRELRGWCGGIGDDSNTFLMMVAPLDDRKVLETVCHECVHIRQYVQKNLVDDPAVPHLKSWRGETYDISATDYDKCPWETEAHAEQTELFESWIAATDQGGAEWLNS